MRARTVGRGALLALGMVPLLAACGQPAASGPVRAQRPATAVTASASVGAVAGVASVVPQVVAHLGGEAHEVLSEPDGSVLWVPEFTGRQALLDRFDSTGAPAGQVVLGPSPSSGINSHVRMAPDGSIWVSDDYAFFRYDPATGSVGTLHLSVDDAHAVPGARSDTAPLPGTWVSAFTFDAAGDLLLARDNVPVLELRSTAGRLLRTVPLPAGIVGVSDMDLRPDGLHLLAGRPADVSGEVSPVVVKVDLSAPRPGRATPLRSTLLGLTQVLLPDGDTIRTGSTGAATLVTAGAGAQAVTLRSRKVQIADPLGRPTTVTVRERVLGAGAGPVGSGQAVWLLLSASGGGTDLARLP
ncbi:hypothetical protein [Intrasporangium sp.]|uniref:hypothetical protein n=1 Tax=Intrasporangium sp. TaxID=1925024 RepID=UPI00322161AB